jgi:hypothetical protein
VAAREIDNIVTRLEDAQRVADSTGNMAQKERVSEAIDKLAEDKSVILQLVENVNPTDPDSLAYIDNLVDILRRAASRTNGLLKEDPNLEKYLDKTTLVSETVTQKAQLQALGLQQIRSSGEARIPTEFTDLWAPATIVKTLNKVYGIERGSKLKEVQSFFDNVYYPYFTSFKNLATIGRPGGYHVRNFIGGVWNNYLGGVGAEDHKLSTKILDADIAAKAKARTALQNIVDGKPSGLSADDAIVAKLAAEVTRRGTGTFDREADQLADYLFQKELDNIQIGEYTARQIIDSFNSQNLVRSARRLERLRDETIGGVDLAEAIRDPDYTNVFRGTTREELNKAQAGLNAVLNFKLFRMSANAADFQERFIRMAAFINGSRRFGLEDGGEAAGYFTKALQFDYQDLSEFERRYLKNIIPFYVWTRRNLPLQFSALVYQPGKFNQLGFAQEEAETYLGAEGDDENALNILPEWARERMGFVSRYNFRGSPISFMVESPAIDLNRYLAFNGLKPSAGRIGRELVSASNPLGKAFIEGMFGFDTFTGGKISEKGALSPFGNIPIPGITFTGPEGEQRVNARGYGILRDLVPTVGLISRLSGRGDDADRHLTNVLSSLLGAPAGTLTPNQVTAEMKAREDRLRKQVRRTAINLGADDDWLRSQLDAGATDEGIRDALAAGYGRRPSSVE